LKNVPVPKANFTDAEAGEFSGSELVVGFLVGVIMVAPVQFDCQPSGVAVKIQDKPADRVLPSELVLAELFVFQSFPEQYFCVSRLVSVFFCEAKKTRRSVLVHSGLVRRMGLFHFCMANRTIPKDCCQYSSM